MSNFYLIKKFGIVESDSGVAIHTQAGIFHIEDRRAAAVLSALSRSNDLLKEEVIQRRIEASGLEKEDFLSYLKDEVCILEERPAISWTYEYHGDREIGRRLSAYLGQKPKKQTESKKLRTLMVYGSLNPREDGLLRSLMDEAGLHAVIMALFFVGNSVAITPPWSARHSSPCAFCCLDYLQERIYFDTADRLMSVGDAIDLLQEGGFSAAPSFSRRKRDIDVACAHASKVVETIFGLNKAWQTPPDPLMLTLVDLDSYGRTGFLPPLSPRCSCVCSYHLNKRVGGH